jgi:Fic family protein
MKKPESPPDLGLNQLDAETLLKLMENQQLSRRLAETDRDYPYWDSFKYKVQSLPFPPRLLWMINKFSREKTMVDIRIGESNAYAFRYNITGSTLKHLHEFDLHLGGILEGRSIIPENDKQRYLISSIMEEAIASSQLEGAVTTREIAKQMLRSNRKPTSLSERMILNNYVTIKHVLEIKDQPLTKELITDLHASVTKGTLNDPAQEGRFRTTNNIHVVDETSGEIFYTPPVFAEIDRLMDMFCAFANRIDEEEFIHPIIRGIILHFLIGYIHPFVDGNGRTARAIFYWCLLANGYWLTEYLSLSKIILKARAQYARAYLYSEYDANDLTYFINYNLKCLDLALKNLQIYIRLKINEKKELFHLIKDQEVNTRQAEILHDLLTDQQKSLSIGEIQTRFGTVYQTARTDLLQLVSLGYLNKRKVGKMLLFFPAEHSKQILKQNGGECDK